MGNISKDNILIDKTEKIKTDQYSTGDEVIVSKGPLMACHWNILL